MRRDERLRTVPSIAESTQDKRRAYVLRAFRCVGNCDACGNCKVFKGEDPESVFADYIAGKKSFMSILRKCFNSNIRA